MSAPLLEIEGTWEEIQARQEELKGKHLRVTAFEKAGDDPSTRVSTGKDLLRFAGIWEGDDLRERLAEVYATRSKVRF